MKAIVTGICGMDGSHLADLLVEKGDECIGFYRRSSTDKFERIDHVKNKIRLEEGDLCDPHYISELIQREKPDVIFNTAAQSHVGTSFKQPLYTIDVNLKGVANILDAIKNHSPKTKLIQCSTSEMWGNNVDSDGMQRESTPFAPRSPYAVSKMAAFDLCRTYREAYDIFACSTICHNHTGPRRGDNFVEKKIINWVKDNISILRANYEVLSDRADDNYTVDSSFTHARGGIVQDNYTNSKLRLGNIYPSRDFGHSKDYVRAMYAMACMDKPKDYVVATGRATSVKELLEIIFKKFDRDYKDFIVIDKQFYRPAEVEFLCGDSSLIREELGWRPQYSLENIIDEMINA